MLDSIDGRSFLVGFMTAGLVGLALGRLSLIRRSYKAYTGTRAFVDIGRSPQKAGVTCLVTVVKSIVYVGLGVGFFYVLLRYLL